jgi:hypothetical protein
LVPLVFTGPAAIGDRRRVVVDVVVIEANLRPSGPEQTPVVLAVIMELATLMVAPLAA